ncbi:uncharacterized protein LOC119082622 [Bradysia coprophila]|uniref:uncharacterized protein LOC119082622 n=1 Tax=Bradysia coprophila TaxID=38358 RepID=UPI00187DBA64|nr:uncharacterized protein LOC119082622 [Bradysia coprophila]
MDRAAKKELLRRKQLAKFRFKTLCRKVIVNAYWLSAIEDVTLGSNPRRNINIIVRRSGRKGILTLREKSIFNKPNQDRTTAEKEQLTAVIHSLKCFETIPETFRGHLMEICHFLYCNAGRVILREGHHPSALYFILDGEVNVSKKVYSADEGRVADNVLYALVPGDRFGLDGVILGNRRSVTCSAAIPTELLYIYEQDLTDELRKSLNIQCEHIRTSLNRFDYFFGHFTDQQILECCTFSKIREYGVDASVYDDDEKKQATTFFLLSGQCYMLQYLKIKSKTTVGSRKTFVLIDETVSDVDDGNERQYVKTDSVNEPQPQKLHNSSTKEHDETVEKIFMEIATLSAGSIFGLGEVIADRAIVARNVVQCLEIPRFWLLQRSQNVGNVWQRTRIFYNATIPSRQLIFDDFVRSFKWSQYRETTTRQLLQLKSKL